jgi:DNA-binding response OmpR family regulator
MDHVLLIDDDKKLAGYLGRWLAARGIQLTARHSAVAGLATLRRRRWDMVLLDIMLPDGDGLELLRTLRAADMDTPVLMLTARGEPFDRVLGLELGADDYLPKPYDPNELLARIRALMRRARRGPALGSRLVFGELVIDRSRREVLREGVACTLTAHQFELLWALASRACRVLDRGQLSATLNNGVEDPMDRTIDVHISRIRAAIEPDPKNPRYIKTVRGAGYIFTSPQT